MSLSTRLNKLLRFKLNQITRKRSGRTRLTILLRWEIFTRPTRKPWLNQAYHASEVRDFNQAYQETLLNQAYQAFEVEILNQIYQKTLVQSGLQGFWGGKCQPGLTGKPGNNRLTKHFWLAFLSRDLSYRTFMVNYN